MNDLAVYEAAASFEPARLTLAREARGMSRKGLAGRVDATPSAVSQFESGASGPSPKTLARLSLALGFPPAFFSRPLSTRLRLELCHFRKRRGTSKREQRQVLARGDLLLSLYEELREDIVFPKEEISEHQAEVSTLDEVEMLAERLRSVWELGLGPISDMIALLERRGVLVLELTGHSKSLDAFLRLARRDAHAVLELGKRTVPVESASTAPTNWVTYSCMTRPTQGTVILRIRPTGLRAHSCSQPRLSGRNTQAG